MKTSTLGMKQASVTSALQSGTENATQQSNIQSHNSRHLDAQHNILRRGFMHLSPRQSIVLSFVLFAAIMLNVPQRVWAETQTVGPFTATADNQWRSQFNAAASPYMSITSLSNDASIKNGNDRYLVPQGATADKNYAYTGTVTVTPASGTYLTNYSFNYFYSGTAGTSTFGDHFCAQGEIKVDGTSKSKAYEGSGTITADLTNATSISISLTTPKTPKGSSGFFGMGAWDGKDNKVGVNNLTFSVKIPEVKDKSGLWEETDNNLAKIKTAGGNVTKDYTYNVADYKDKDDFKVTLTKKNGSGVGSSATATIQSVSGTTLTVRFTYTAGSTGAWQEDYSYDLLVESKNTVNTQSFTTHINGSATDQLSANTLAFIISSDQKVNTQYTKEQTVSSNNTAKNITLSSNNIYVAYFDDYDVLHIVGAGSATLTAEQAASDEIAAKTTTFTLNVTKRQVTLAYNPAGALYTGKTYENYVSVTNNTTGTFPGLSYSLNTNDYIDIYAAATITTKQTPGNTTLTITSEETDEWEATNINKTVEVVKDPASLDICLTQDVYKDFIKETSFCQKKTDDGTIFVTDDNKLCQGEANDRTVFTSTFEIHFIGIPKDLSFTYTRPTDGFFTGGGWFGLDAADQDYTLTIQESDEAGSSWNTLYTNSTSGATGATTVNKDLNENTRRIRITYTGVRYVYFTNFCINAKKDFSVPASATITQSASGFNPANFVLLHSMMKSISVTSTNPNFAVSPATLGMANGLGYGNGEVQLQVSYTGSDISETTTLNFAGIDMDDSPINKSMTVSLDHPTHYAKGQVSVGTGDGNVYIGLSNTQPADGDYVSKPNTMTTDNVACDQGATDNGDYAKFYLFAKPNGNYMFAQWQDGNGNFVSESNPAEVGGNALSDDPNNPTLYRYRAIFFRGFQSGPEFGVDNLDMGYTFSGGQIVGNLPLTNPRYIESDKVTITFVDIDGHTGEATLFSQYGQYVPGAQNQYVPIRFLPDGPHYTAKTYQAKAIITAKNTEYDIETGEPLSTLREVTHECIVTATCYPAEAAVFTVPEEIDFGAPITIAEQAQTHDLSLTDMINVYGTPTISLSNSYFTADAYNATTHSFTIHYNTANTTEGLLTTTATVTGLNADGVATTATTTLKIFIGKPEFTVADLDLGTTTSGGDNLYKYLELTNANGLDVTRVTIAISDKSGHTGESQYFSALVANPDWEGEEDTEHEQYISSWDPDDKTFLISFVPSAMTPTQKTYQATATITATNAKGSTTKTITLSAVVNPAGAASFSIASSHTFTSVQRNVTDTWAVVPTNMQNIVGAPSVDITGTNAAYFSFAGYDEGTNTLTFNFTPTAVGNNFTATATVTFYNRDGNASTPATITLKGSCVPAPEASFEIHNSEGQEVNNSYYGDFYVGEPAYEQTFYIANIQNMKVGSQPTLTLSNAKFSQVSYNPVTQAFVISFAATAGMEGVQSALATFTMLNNDDQETSKTLSLSAFVVIEPDYDVEVIAADGTTVLKQGTWAECLTVANTAANAGCTMRLIKNITLTATKDIKNTFTLDLNGKTITAAIKGAVLHPMTAGKKFTIKDSKSGGKIQNTVAYSANTAYVVNVEKGEFILKSGTLYLKNTTSGYGGYAINQGVGTNVTVNNGKIEVYGNKTVRGINQASDKNDNTIFTMDNGEIYVEGATDIYGIYAYGKVNVNGGTINAKATYTNSRGISLHATGSTTDANCYYATLNMTGGTINSNCTSDANDTRYAYGILFNATYTGMGTETAKDGTKTNKATPIGSIYNATINVSTLGRYAIGVQANGSYNSKTNTYDKIYINNSTVNATAKYYYAYGVYATGAVDATNNVSVSGTTGAVYFANMELSDCNVTATVTTYTTAYAVWATTGAGTIYKDKQANYYGEFAGGATVTVNSGTYTATTGTSNAYAIGTNARSKTIYDSETSVYASRKLSTAGASGEGYATLNIYGGKFIANSGSTTARAVSNGGNCTIIGGEFYATAGSSTADGIYTVSGKLKATGAKIVATATTSTAYGVRVDVSDIPAGNQAWTGFTYHGDAELNNLDVTVTTGSSTSAFGIYANAKALLYTSANFEAQKKTSNWSENAYNTYKAVSPVGQAFSDYARVKVDGGTYKVTSGTSTAYGAFSNTTAVAADKTAVAAATMDIRNATFNVQTNTTTEARGIYSSGLTTIDGCNITATSKTTTAYGVLVADNKTTITNTKITVTTTNSDNTKAADAFGIYGTVDINATHAYKRYADIELGEGNEVLAKTTSGTGAYAVYLNATKRNIASGTYAGDYAVAAKAVVNGGKYTAQAAGTTGYALNVVGQQVQGSAVAQPELTVNGGKFKGTAASAYADLNANGIAGHVVLNGGYYVLNTNLAKYVADGSSVITLTGGQEFSEGYQYTIGKGSSGNIVCKVFNNNGALQQSYATLEEALQFVNSNTGTEYVIVMVADYKLTAGDYRLPSKATLVVPKSLTQTKVQGTTPNRVTGAPAPVQLVQLTFLNGVNMTIYGKIETNADNTAANGGSAITGAPTGNFGRLHIEKGAKIDLESGSEMRSWGYVTGKGEINAKRGSILRESFQLGYWRGGTATTKMMNNASSWHAFPVDDYYYQNIECPITYHPGSKAYGYSGVNVSIIGVQAANDVQLVGTTGDNAMFLMDNAAVSELTYVKKEYFPDGDTIVWTVASGAKLGNLHFSLAGKTVKSEDYYLPVTSNMIVNVEKGDFTITQDALIIPGGKICIAKEGKVIVTSGKKLFIDDGEDRQKVGGYYYYPVLYSPSWPTKTNPRTQYRPRTAIQPDGEIFVHGETEGSFYTSTKGANIHSTNPDAGKVKFVAAAGANTSIKQIINTDCDLATINFTTAQLRNEITATPYTSTEGASAGDAYIYMEKQWVKVKDGCLTERTDGSGTHYYYANPSDVIEVEDNDDHAYKDKATGTRFFIFAEKPLSNASCVWWEATKTTINGTTYYVANQEKYDNFGTHFYWDESAGYWKPYYVTVTWKQSDGTTIDTYSNVPYGTRPIYNSASPTIPNTTTTAKYAWIGWTDGSNNFYERDGEMPIVTSNTTFTAKIEETKIQYLITFKNSDGSPLEAVLWSSGEIPSYSGGTPTQSSTASQTYTFSSWNPQITAVSAAKTYTAQYTATTRQYDVTFLDYDNTELESKKVNYNTPPTSPSKPERIDPEDYYIYEFTDWKNQQTGTTGLAAVKGDQTYVAQYSHHRKWFYVTFVDYNGTTITTSKVLHDTRPTAPANPTREQDAQYTYSFSGWAVSGTTTPLYSASNIPIATANITYVAQYNATLRSYDVRFFNYDGTQIGSTQTLNYGATPTEPDHASFSKPSTAEYEYIFSSWDDIIREVTGAKDYTAQYLEQKRKYTVTFYDEDGTTVLNKADNNSAIYQVEYGAKLSETPPEPTKAASAEYTYIFNGWLLSGTTEPLISSSELKTNNSYAVTTNTAYVAHYREEANSHTIAFYNTYAATPKLEEKPVAHGEIPEYTGTTPAREQTAEYTYTFVGWIDYSAEEASATPYVTLPAATADASYKAKFTAQKRSYTVTFYNENGTQELQSGSVEYGTAPTYSGTTQTKASDKEWDYTFDGWQASGVGEVYSTLPGVTGDVSYTAHFNPTHRHFVVTFKDEDGITVLQTLSGATAVEYGTTPTYTGFTPTKATDEDYTYTFAGWSPALDNITSDAIFTATYTPTERFYGEEYKLDIVEWSANGANQSITLNMNNYSLPDVKTEWTVQVGDRRFYNAVYSRVWRDNRTLVINNLTLTPGEYIVLKVRGDKDECVSRLAYTVPYIYNANATLTAQGEMATTSTLCVNNGTLTIDADITADQVLVSPGASLTINAGKTLTVNKTMLLRTTPFSSAVLLNDGSLTLGASAQMYYSRIMSNNSQSYQWGLPFSVDLTKTRFSNGTNATQGRHFGLMYYDAVSRAQNGKDALNWVLYSSTAQQRNTGYQMIVGSPYYFEIYFPVDYSTRQTDGAQISVTAYGEESNSANNRGWNYIVSPYTHVFNCGTPAKPEEALKISVLNSDNETFTQYVPTTIQPAMPFYYQAEADGTLEFTSGSLRKLAPRRMSIYNPSNDVPTQWIELLFGNAADELDKSNADITNIYLHPTKFSAEYELGYDVAKLSTQGAHPLLWAKTVAGDLAFAALPDSLCQNLPLAVSVPTEGLYTFALNDNDYTSRIDNLILLDALTGTETDLRRDTYTCLVEAGQTTARFFLIVKMKESDIATDIDNIGEKSSIERPMKLFIDGYIYILMPDGRMYDAVGKRVK